MEGRRGKQMRRMEEIRIGWERQLEKKVKMPPTKLIIQWNGITQRMFLIPVYAATTELKKFFVSDLLTPLSFRIAGKTFVTVFNTPFSSHWYDEPELLRLTSTSAKEGEEEGRGRVWSYRKCQGGSLCVCVSVCVCAHDKGVVCKEERG